MTSFQETYGLIKYTKGISKITKVRAGHHCELGDCENAKIISDVYLPDYWPTHTLHRDHCHEHGYIRGFTCYRCNWSLAWIEQFWPAYKECGEGVYENIMRTAMNHGYRLKGVPDFYRNLCPGCADA